MRTDRPPVVATWLLIHFSADNDALAGDLVEEFSLGRSAGWYWRQVLAAVAAGGARRFQSDWPAVAFAAAWSASSPALCLLPMRLLGEDTSTFGHAWRIDWTWSTRYEGAFEILALFSVLWLGVALFAALHAFAANSLSLTRAFRGLLLVVPTFAAANLLLAAATAALNAMALQHPTVTGAGLPALLALARSPYCMVFIATLIPSICASAHKSGSGRGDRLGAPIR